MKFQDEIPELKIKVDKRYQGFNAGMYLYSLKKLREMNLTKKALEILYFNVDMRKIMNHGTQPLMNLLFNGKSKPIDHRWNLTGLGWQRNIEKSILEGAFILHWSGPKKPWLNEGLYKEYWII